MQFAKPNPKGWPRKIRRRTRIQTEDPESCGAIFAGARSVINEHKGPLRTDHIQNVGQREGYCAILVEEADAEFDALYVLKSRCLPWVITGGRNGNRSTQNARNSKIHLN